MNTNKLILMLDPYMPNITLDKTINTNRNKNIRLSKLIKYLYKHELLSRLPMKSCKSNHNNNINITSLNCKMMLAWNSMIKWKKILILLDHY
ncbi:MAG: hypothetical protein Ta2E_00900 [Mycoplasmoidaceae bacterium]|nr:MAG: hypothetical protein Ta2E_00900 [Mycoplasmoidaceae bacterium]